MNVLRIKALEKRVEDLEKRKCCITPPGPYADDAAAEAAGVGIGQAYYQPSGAVVVRLT